MIKMKIIIMDCWGVCKHVCAVLGKGNVDMLANSREPLLYYYVYVNYVVCALSHGSGSTHKLVKG